MDEEILESEGAMVCLRTCGSNLEANLLRSVLEANGISCLLQGENHRALLGPLGVIDVRLMVPAQQAAEANHVLRENEATAREHEVKSVREEVPTRLGSSYREPYPPRIADKGRRVRPVVWRPFHTVIAVAGVLVVVLVALAAALGR